MKERSKLTYAQAQDIITSLGPHPQYCEAREVVYNERPAADDPRDWVSSGPTSLEIYRNPGKYDRLEYDGDHRN